MERVGEASDAGVRCAFAAGKALRMAVFAGAAGALNVQEQWFTKYVFYR